MVKTADGGKTWETISPDLSRETYEIPASVASYRDAARRGDAPRRGLCHGPSYLDVNVHLGRHRRRSDPLTRDGGKNWKNVTPPALNPWSKVSLIDASHFDDRTVYAAINSFRLDDLKPHIFRTHDNGETWQETVRGLPDGAHQRGPRRSGAQRPAVRRHANGRSSCRSTMATIGSRCA